MPHVGGLIASLRSGRGPPKKGSDSSRGRLLSQPSDGKLRVCNDLLVASCDRTAIARCFFFFHPFFLNTRALCGVGSLAQCAQDNVLALCDPSLSLGALSQQSSAARRTTERGINVFFQLQGCFAFNALVKCLLAI